MEQSNNICEIEMDRVKASKKFVSIVTDEFKATNVGCNIKLQVNEKPNRGNNTELALSNKAMQQINLDPNILSFICGTIFGDSSIGINTGYANARVQFRHSTRQMEWFFWKVQCPFAQFVTANSAQMQAPDGHQKKAERQPGECLGKVKIATKVDPLFTELFKIIAVDNKKTIQRSWLNHMTVWFLVALWLDDGSLTGKGREGNISINKCTQQEADILVQYLDVVWGIKAQVKNSKSRQTTPNPVAPDITFLDLDNLEKFLRLVAPLVPVKSMLYKVCLTPLDPVRLQRWASYLKQVIRPEWHDEIDKIYLYYVLTKGEIPDEIDI